MTTRMRAPRVFDVGAFARRVNARRVEYNRRHPAQPVPISDVLSRILEHDDEYIPYRVRRTHIRPPIQNPRIDSVIRIAASLRTTVGDLLGERGFSFSHAERRTLRWIVRSLIRAFDLDDPSLNERESGLDPNR
jgi:hypothetical protein